MAYSTYRIFRHAMYALQPYHGHVLSTTFCIIEELILCHDSCSSMFSEGVLALLSEGASRVQRRLLCNSRICPSFSPIPHRGLQYQRRHQIGTNNMAIPSNKVYYCGGLCARASVASRLVSPHLVRSSRLSHSSSTRWSDRTAPKDFQFPRIKLQRLMRDIHETARLGMGERWGR